MAANVYFLYNLLLFQFKAEYVDADFCVRLQMPEMIILYMRRSKT